MNILTALCRLVEQPIEKQQLIIQRFYCWSNVFTSKIHRSKRRQAKAEFERIIGIAKLSNKSLGEQIAYELEHPNEFILLYYKEFLETAMYLVGTREEDISKSTLIKSIEVGQSEMFTLLLQDLHLEEVE